jgi:hypothetical protein
MRLPANLFDVFDFVIVDKFGSPYDLNGHYMGVSYDYVKIEKITLAKAVTQLRADFKKIGLTLGRDVWVLELTASKEYGPDVPLVPAYLLDPKIVYQKTSI